ncbi:PREDICTED: uncharacterized protein LOC108775754 [Cyphomyrmex costatus]|uniref:uncharacterized protein LOC108775754 n=1 Tax=Cyphomyrmex costatus TaxID=456900 RepID=UPI0008521D1C|nr:PREDICTED: uncharacterized protein LOC108775754 [Cyphomyrmex costatus]
MRPYTRFNRGYHYILTVIDVLSKHAWAIPLKAKSGNEASVVERFNRTLKNDMWKQFTYNGSYKWIEMLPRLVSDYNARKHRTIGMRPADVTPAIAERLLGFTPNWTTEVFKIIKVQQTNPVTYLLEDSRGELIAGGFYEYELHRVANPDVYLVEKVLRKRGNEVYVKWLGLDKSHNSWIHKDNVL